MIKKTWSTGEKYEQSMRDNRNKNIYEEIQNMDNTKVNEEEIVDMRNHTNEFRQRDNKKEETSKRMADRQMVMLGTLNPFVKVDYLRDLQNQEEFLKPKNSSYKEKS